MPAYKPANQIRCRLCGKYFPREKIEYIGNGVPVHVPECLDKWKKAEAEKKEEGK